jgi:hypothetical protein
MKRDYPKEVNPELLHEELEAIPGMLTIEDREGFDGPVRVAHYRMILFEGLGVRIEVDDKEFDFKQVDDVIAAHDKGKKSQLALAREAKQVKKEAVLSKLGITEEELKDLLGG